MPGIAASALYETGPRVYDDAGLAEGAGILFGHGIGLEIWERPFVRRTTTRRGRAPAAGDDDLPRADPGARRGRRAQGLFVVEDMVAITRAGAEVLSEGLDRAFARIPA